MIYMACLCLIDTCCLYTWNFSIVYRQFTNRKIEHENAIAYRLFSFLCYFVLQSSSWLIGFDRVFKILDCTILNYLSINAKAPLHITYTFLKNALNKKSLIVSLLTLIALFGLNFVVVFKNAEPPKPTIRVVNNRTVITYPNRTYSCYEPKCFYSIWAFLPIFIMLAQNTLIIVLIIRHAHAS
jgi:hypothetical protein